MRNRLLLLILILALVFIAGAFVFFVFAGEQQSIRVRGKIICGRTSVNGVSVELRERDIFNPDDLLNVTTTGPDGGKFDVSGTKNEIVSIRPYLRITHKCDVEDELKCIRITEFDIPKSKVQIGFYEMHTVNLEVRGSSDTEICED